MLLYYIQKISSFTTVFTRISAAALIKFFAPQVRRLFEGGAYSRAALIWGRRLFKNWTQETIEYRRNFYSNKKKGLLIVRIRLLRKRVFALAVPTKFTAFTTLTELRIVRILDRKIMDERTLNCETSLLTKRNFQGCFRVALSCYFKLHGIPRISSSSWLRRLFRGGAY